MSTWRKIRDAKASITRVLDLGDFDEMYQGAVFEVEVAPTRAHLQEWAGLTDYIQGIAATKDEMTEDEKDDAMETWQSRRVEWYAKTWRNISLEEAQEIYEALPQVAWDWLTRRTSQMIGEFRREKLGNSNGG